MTTTALLLIDAQRDFIAHPDLSPAAPTLIDGATRLLDGARRLGLPVLHTHLIVAADRTGCMPHQRAAERLLCVEGTPGAAAVIGLDPAPGEPVFVKRVFSPFTDPSFDEALRARGIDHLVLAGVHLHACVSKTALDAYERGYAVWIAADAVASYDPVHAALVRRYLDARGLRFLDGADILTRLAPATSLPARPRVPTPMLPVAFIENAWIQGDRSTSRWRQQAPSAWAETLAEVPIAEPADVTAAVTAAHAAKRPWAARPHVERAHVVAALASALDRRREAFAQIMATEIGKPIVTGRAEVDQSIALLRVATTRFAEAPPPILCADGRVEARRRPLGVIAAVTPWNNPIAIAIGKLAPAILFGNTVVWKPALEAPRTSALLIEALVEAGVPAGVVNLIHGDAATTHHLLAAREVGAVSFTGSSRAGRQVALRCAESLTPLQAELGGNNAAIVLPDAALAIAAQELVRSAFDFAGQRCTATRRIVVHARVREGLIEACLAAMDRLTIGDPHDAHTDLGPLISRAQQQRVTAVLAEAEAGGARIHQRALDASLIERGCWTAPALVIDCARGSAILDRETFGPVLFVQTAASLDEAIALVNAAPQGLVASLYTDDPSAQRVFLDAVEVGIAKLNQPTRGAEPDAPFSGWKESGFGPPEHGVWDLEFFTRAQAIYRSPPRPIGE